MCARLVHTSNRTGDAFAQGTQTREDRDTCRMGIEGRSDSCVPQAYSQMDHDSSRGRAVDEYPRSRPIRSQHAGVGQATSTGGKTASEHVLARLAVPLSGSSRWADL